MAAIFDTVDLENQFRHALQRPFAGEFGTLVGHAVGLVIEREGDGVENGRFTASRLARDGEKRAVDIGGVLEIDFPRAIDGIHVLDGQLLDSHCLPPMSLRILIIISAGL